MDIGFLRDLQGKIFDAMTYQLLEQNFKLLSENLDVQSDKCLSLEEKNQALMLRIKDLEVEVSRLHLICGSLPNQPFVEHRGAFWRRTPLGFSAAPHCLVCQGVLSKPGAPSYYVCKKCGYERDLDAPYAKVAQELHHIL